MALTADRMGRLGTENAFGLGDDIQRCLDRGIKVIRFNLGAPDFRSAPFLNRIASDALDAGRSGYCDPAGIPSFRQAIARQVSRTRDIEVDPAQVVVTPGAKPPLGYTMQCYVNEGDEVVYPTPGFPMYESWARFSRARAVPLRLDAERDFTFGAEDLAALLTERTKVIVLCSPSNPTGGVLSREELADIAALVRERCHPDVRVLSDEIYEHTLFDGRRHESIVSHRGMVARTVLVSGLSKGFAMTGWRLGWAVLPTREEAELFKRMNINTVSCVPPFLQEAGQAAFEHPDSPATARRMVDAFERRRDWIVPRLDAIDGMSCRTPKGAFYVFPDVSGVCRNLRVYDAHRQWGHRRRRRTSPSGMLQMFLLYRHGVATMDRASFGTLGAEGQDHLRLSIANSMDDIQEGVERIARAAQDREGFAAFARSDDARQLFS